MFQGVIPSPCLKGDCKGKKRRRRIGNYGLGGGEGKSRNDE
jgi:hypothetical protein